METVGVDRAARLFGHEMVHLIPREACGQQKPTTCYCHTTHCTIASMAPGTWSGTSCRTLHFHVVDDVQHGPC